MSKRKEDFKKAAEEYDDSPDVVQGIIARTGFEFGAEHGYQYAIEKIFKCIEDQAIFGWIEDIEVDKFLEKIRKTMQ